MKTIITAALTGVLATREQCPAIPYTPEEIGEEARRAAEAGAAIVHVHARQPDGKPAFDAATYGQIKREIESRCDVILNFSTGAVGIPIEARVAHVREHKPDLAALNMGSMNYAIYSEKKKTFHHDLVFANPFKDIIYLLEAMNAAGVKPELECFDTGHVGNTAPLLDMGVLRPPLQFSLILGVLGGIPATTENLAHMARQLPSGSAWQVIGIGLAQWKLAAAAITLGGNVRVGLEDNFYLEPGMMARSNGELAAKAVRLVRELGGEVATVAEAREALGLKFRPLTPPPPGKL